MRIYRAAQRLAGLPGDQAGRAQRRAQRVLPQPGRRKHRWRPRSGGIGRSARMAARPIWSRTVSRPPRRTGPSPVAASHSPALGC